MIVPDWYNRFFNYTKNYCKKKGFLIKISQQSDSILSSCWFWVICIKLDQLRFSEVAKNKLFLDQNQDCMCFKTFLQVLDDVFFGAPFLLVFRDAIKKNNHWICDHDHTSPDPPPSFLKTVIALGNFFSRSFLIV